MDDSRPPEPSGRPDASPGDTRAGTDSSVAASSATTWTRQQTLALAVGTKTTTAGCSAVLPECAPPVEAGDWAFQTNPLGLKTAATAAHRPDLGSSLELCSSRHIYYKGSQISRS